MKAAAIKLCVQLREINVFSLGYICAISVRCRPLKRISLNTSIFASLLEQYNLEGTVLLCCLGNRVYK